MPLFSAVSEYSPEEDDVDDVSEGVDADEWPGELVREDVDETGGEGDGTGDSALVVNVANSAVGMGGEVMGALDTELAVSPETVVAGK